MHKDHTTLNITETFGSIDRNYSTQQCLTVEVGHMSDSSARKQFGSFGLKWNAVKCNQQQTVLCEIRVETITYAWVPNWMAFVLIILTISSLLSFIPHFTSLYRLKAGISCAKSRATGSG